MMNEEGRVKKKRGDNHISSGTIVCDCQDLLISILIHLPARTLVSFKLVSKQFRSVISDPQFCINHVRLHHGNRKSLAPTALYFYSSFSNCPKIFSVSLSDPANSIPSLAAFEDMAFRVDRQFKIVQSCNGLLLCCFDNGTSSDSRLYFVCNPTTFAFTMLPELPRIEFSSKSKKSKNQEEHSPPVLTLAFNPLQTHIYKVFAVRVVKQLSRKTTCELLVHSSGEGGRAWRKVGCQFSFPVTYNRIRHGVFHDGGNITWICESGFIHFDVQSEKVREVKERAMHPSRCKKIRFFGECIDGRLQLIKLGNCGVVASELKAGTSEWGYRGTAYPQRLILKRHLAGAENVLYRRKCMGCRDMYQILAVANGPLLGHLIIAIPGMVFRYCQINKNATVLRQMPQQFREDFSFDWVTSFQFVETLSPV